MPGGCAISSRCEATSCDPNSRGLLAWAWQKVQFVEGRNGCEYKDVVS